MKTSLINKLKLVVGACLIGITLAGCVAAVGPAPGGYWVPGHYGPYGGWHPGHWNYY